jgi:putative ABC transport system permease protein
VKLDEDRRTPPTAYLPLRFVPTRDCALMIRARAPVSLTPALRGAIHAADPVVPVFNAWSMEEVRYLSFWMYALWSTMFAAFGLIALVLATIGVYGVIHYGVGLLAALALTRVVESLLIGVSSLDAASFVGVAIFLSCVAALASYLPARRAMRVDPLIALREE